LPSIEAYYLGTPVCYVIGTSIEEILVNSTSLGGFQLDSPETIWSALDDILAMSPEEVRRIGIELRKRFAAKNIVDRMLEGFQKVVQNT
jgi:hypothetical protein